MLSRFKSGLRPFSILTEIGGILPKEVQTLTKFSSVNSKQVDRTPPALDEEIFAPEEMKTPSAPSKQTTATPK